MLIEYSVPNIGKHGGNPIVSGKLATLAEEFVSTAMSEGSDNEQVGSIAQEFFKTAQSCSEKEISSALGILSSAFQSPNFEQAVLAAQMCGALVENGVSPAEMQEELFGIIRLALSMARRSADRILSQIAPESERYEAFSELLEKEFELAPEDAVSWSIVEGLYMPCIAVLSHSAESRKAAADLLDDAHKLSEFCAGARWIARMLMVLDNEPYLAIEPDTGFGITGKFSGISGNFQLNELLMAVFPHKGMFPKRRVSKTVEDTARGKGPQQPGEHVTGQWNLCTWQALDKDGKLPTTMVAENWIWNEGIPADIPSFEGYRVILLGPASYSRSWNSCRDFSALKADLTVEKKLSPKEVDDWLKKFTDSCGAPGETH